MSKTKTSVIYVIRNKYSNKIYVGSSVDFKQRKISHLGELRKGVHVNIHLQNAFIKYKEDAFEFEIVEMVEDPKDLITKEQSWIDKFNFDDLYNICPTAAPFGRKISDQPMGRRMMTLPEQLDKQLVQEAETSGLAMSDIIRRAIEEYIKTQQVNRAAERAARE